MMNLDLSVDILTFICWNCPLVSKKQTSHLSLASYILSDRRLDHIRIKGIQYFTISFFVRENLLGFGGETCKDGSYSRVIHGLTR